MPAPAVSVPSDALQPGASVSVTVTPVNVTLPSAADNQPLVQIRVMTTLARP